MANIQERRDRDGKTRYRVQIRLKGYAAQTATFDRKTDAKEWARQTETDLKAGRHLKTAEAKRHTFGEMIDRYTRSVLPLKSRSSQYTQTIQLNWWKEQLGDYILSDVTPPVIAEARDLLSSGETYRHTRRSQSTVIRYLAVLSHCYSVATKEWGWVDDSPMRKVTKPKEPRGRVRFLSDDERVRLLAACKESRNPCLYDVIVLALSTGMRKSEILSLKWQDVDLSRGVITLLETKNNERRAVPLSGFALKCLGDRNRARRIDSPYVFPAPFRHGEKPKPVDLQSAWDWAVKRAGIEDFRFHDLRHTAASYLCMSGATIPELAGVLGHKTLQMVKRYAHLSDPHTASIVRRMNQEVFGDVENRETHHG